MEILNCFIMETSRLTFGTLLILMMVSGLVGILISLYKAYRKVNPRNYSTLTKEKELKNIGQKLIEKQMSVNYI